MCVDSTDTTVAVAVYLGGVIFQRHTGGVEGDTLQSKRVILETGGLPSEQL